MLSQRPPQSPFFVPFLLATAALGLAAVPHAFGQASTRLTPLAPILPNHYLVAYRNGSIPSDAAARTSLAGARILRRHDRLGIAVVQANGTASDDANLRHLSAQPNVDYVVHDRLVYAHQIAITSHSPYHDPLAVPLIPVTTTLPSPTPVTPTPTPTPVAPTPTPTPVAPTPTPSPTPVIPASPTAPTATVLPDADSYYNTPQAWAVQQVGGYGANTPGGPAYGPWSVTMGKGVRIAILDSGVDQNHPDIAPNLVFNLSEIDQTALPSPCDDGTPQDQAGHGTWTASLAAGAAGPTTGEVIGVAPAASILNIKVLERLPDTTMVGATPAQQCTGGSPSGLLSWILQGIDDAIAQHADIISMSLGSMVDLSTGDGAGLKTLFDSATYAASQTGAILIAAAGNDGFDLSNPRYVELPAQARGVIPIIASTNAACAENTAAAATCAPGPITMPYYSNYGANLNALAAPGGSVPPGGDQAVSGWVRGACSAGKPNTIDGPTDATHSMGCFNLGHTQYVQAMGTSASAPLAAGVAALIRAAHPTWDAATVIDTLRSSATAIATLSAPQVNAATAIGAGN